MNAAVNTLYAEYLDHTGGDKAAAASLTLAAVMADGRVQDTADPSALTVAKAAAHLNLCSKKVYQMCRAGELRTFKAGRAIRIPLAEIERFAAEAATVVKTSPRAVGIQHF